MIAWQTLAAANETAWDHAVAGRSLIPDYPDDQVLVERTDGTQPAAHAGDGVVLGVALFDEDSMSRSVTSQ